MITRKPQSSRAGRVSLLVAISSLLFLAVVVETIDATPQRPNFLTFKGKDYPIYEDPMEEYFKANPKKMPQSDFAGSNLWRGYVAYFEIRDDFLILKDIKIPAGFVKKGEFYYEQMKSVLSETVDNGRPLKLEWCTRLIVAAYGDNPSDPYSWFTYSDSFERYTVFEIDRGRFRRSKDFNNKEFLLFRKRQFTAFKRSKDFEPLVTKLSANGRSREDAEAIIKDWILGFSKRFMTEN